MKFAFAPIAFTLAAPALSFAGPASAQSGHGPYLASGSAPVWNLRIDRGLIRFLTDRGKTHIIAPAPAARPSFNGLRYVTPRITVDVTYARCIDAQGDAWHDRVVVTFGRRTVRGCGGDRLPPTLALNGTRWTIASVDGRPARTARMTEIRFSGNRVQGNAGCNSFGGDYRLDGDRLTATRLISTRMACPGPGMEVERTFLAAIASAKVSGAGRTMMLRGPRNAIELRQLN